MAPHLTFKYRKSGWDMSKKKKVTILRFWEGGVL